MHLPLLGFAFFLSFFFLFLGGLYYKVILYITRGVPNKAVEKKKKKLIILKEQFGSIHLTTGCLIFFFAPECQLPEKRSDSLVDRNFSGTVCNISSMRLSVSSPYETLRRELKKYDAQRSIFDELRGISPGDETLP